jgi:molybdopterin-guanine dinucleotide biosynthesis protein A
MGRTKGDLTVGGVRLAARAAECLKPLCRGVVISIRAGGPNPAPGYPAIEDAPPAGRGPLAGIQAAFVATRGADLLVLACDYPRVDTPLLARLLELATVEDDAVIATDSGSAEHPLVGLWRARTAGAIVAALGQGRHAVRELLRELRVRRPLPEEFAGLDLDASLINVNVPGDLERLPDTRPGARD